MKPTEREKQQHYITRTIQLHGNSVHCKDYGFQRSKWVDCHDRRVGVLSNGYITYGGHVFKLAAIEDGYFVRFTCADPACKDRRCASNHELRIIQDFYQTIMEIAGLPLQLWVTLGEVCGSQEAYVHYNDATGTRQPYDLKRALWLLETNQAKQSTFESIEIAAK